MNGNDIKTLFGKRVKELRNKMGYTQEQLAELIEVGERNLSKIECGNVFVKASTIAKLMSALNVDSSELFDFSNILEKENYKSDLIQAIMSDSVDIELLNKIYRAIKF